MFAPRSREKWALTSCLSYPDLPLYRARVRRQLSRSKHRALELCRTYCGCRRIRGCAGCHEPCRESTLLVTLGAVSFAPAPDARGSLMRETTASFLKALCAVSPGSAGTTDRDLMVSTRPVSFRPPDMSGVTERPPAGPLRCLPTTGVNPWRISTSVRVRSPANGKSSGWVFTPWRKPVVWHDRTPPLPRLSWLQTRNSPAGQPDARMECTLFRTGQSAGLLCTRPRGGGMARVTLHWMPAGIDAARLAKHEYVVLRA